MNSRQADFPTGCRIASQLVGDQLQRWPPLPLQDLAEGALGGTCQECPRRRLLVHRSPEIPAPPVDRSEDLIHMPDIAKLILPPAQIPSQDGTELATPQSDRLVGQGDAALGERVLDIPEAVGETMRKPHGGTDKLGRDAAASIQRFHRSSGQLSSTDANSTAPLRTLGATMDVLDSALPRLCGLGQKRTANLLTPDNGRTLLLLDASEGRTDKRLSLQSRRTPAIPTECPGIQG